MLTTLFAVAAGAWLGRRGVVGAAQDLLGAADKAVKAGVFVGRGVYDQAARLAGVVADKAANAAAKAKTTAELAELLRDNPELLEQLRALQQGEEDGIKEA